MNAFSIEDLRQKAKRYLPKAVFDMADGGAEDEKSLFYNREIFNRFYFVPRVLQDVSQRLLTTPFLRKTIDLPLAIAPMGMAGLLYPKADLAIAKAAKSMGVPYTLSTMATSTIEEIAAIGGCYGFQLYVLKNRRITETLVERADYAHCQFLILTVDFPLSGKRERDLKNRFTMPYRPSIANLFDFAMHPRWSFNLWRHGVPTLVNLQKTAQENVQALYAVLNQELDPSLTWEDFKWLRKIWQKPLLVKGLLAAEDCKIAFDHGADAVILSNHGGRQLDGTTAPLAVLPEIRQALGKEPAIFIDSGFRRGADVIKALCLGANGVFLGKALLYGVAAGGEKGAKRALDIFKDEMERAMALLGVSSLTELNHNFLRKEEGL